MRDIWLLRLRALLARAHGDEARYREYRDRYREMAKTPGFEGISPGPTRCCKSGRSGWENDAESRTPKSVGVHNLPVNSPVSSGAKPRCVRCGSC